MGNLTKELKLKVRKEHEELHRKVSNYKGTLAELCKELGGFNLEEDFFDVNWGSGVYTVEKGEEGLRLNGRVDVWDETGFDVIAGNILIDGLGEK